MKPDTKACTDCGQTLPRSSFHKNGSSLSGRCKACTSAHRNAAYAADPQRYRARAARWRAEHPEHTNQQRMRWREAHKEQVRHYQQHYYHTVTKPKRAQARAQAKTSPAP